MAFTYDPTLADAISRVRNMVQDTVEVVADFQDEELQYFLTANGDSEIKAAREAAFRLYVKYSKMADVQQVAKVRLEYFNRAQAMKDLWDAMAKDVATRSGKAMIYFGGLNRDNFNTNRNDASVTKPDFTKGTVFNDPDQPADV